MKKLYFETPTSEAFLKILQPLWANEAFSVYLIGHNDLAAELDAEAAQQEVTFQRSDVLPTLSSGKVRLLIFTENSGEELSSQLLACVDLDNVVIVAPITDWHFSQKPLFLVSIPKAGTHLIYELAQALGYRAGIEDPEFPEGQTWYCVEYTNSHTVARDFFVDTVRRSPFGNRHHRFMYSPALFIYRHPLDILVSEAHYYHKDGKTAFAGWFDGNDFDERVIRLLNDNWLIGSLRERIGGFLPWLNFPNVISLSFEELIGAAGGGNDEDQLQLIWSIQLKLQAPGDPREIASRLFNPDSATFRSGQLGGYKKHLPAHIVSDFAMQNEDILTTLGYPLDGSVGLPMGRESRRKRNIRFSKVDSENMPLTIERDFMGCNLVRYSGRIYAVPIAAGPVSFGDLSDEVLGAIPSAHSISEIKTALLMSNNDLFPRYQSLNQLAQVIQGLAPVESVYQYWQNSNRLSIIEEYNGFNLVSFRGRFFGIRLEVGAIDISQNPVSLIQNFTSDDVLISHSLEQLRDDIDGVSTSKRACQEVVVAHKTAMAVVAAFEAQLIRLSDTTLIERELFKQTVEKLRRDFVEEVEALRQDSTAAAAEVEKLRRDFTEEVEALRRDCAAEVETLRRESSAENERMLATMSSIEAQLDQRQKQIIEQDQQIQNLYKSWAVRLPRRIKRVLRGNK